MDVMKRLAAAAVVPVVVLEDAANAVPTARAMLAGGVDVMEITFRTAAAADSIRAVAAECPDMLVGAGTVITLDQCKLAVECGAKFIVSPGFDAEVVAWCVAQGIPCCPGCVTPTEIMAAKKLGLNCVKFFPANVYGGLKAIKALSGPFVGMKFIPTGGVSTDNIAEFVSTPVIHAVGGSWVCPKADISAGNWDNITRLCREAREAAMGLTAEGAPVALTAVSDTVATNSIAIAAPALARLGWAADEASAAYKGDRMVSVTLRKDDTTLQLVQKGM